MSFRLPFEPLYPSSRNLVRSKSRFGNREIKFQTEKAAAPRGALYWMYHWQPVAVADVSRNRGRVTLMLDLSQFLIPIQDRTVFLNPSISWWINEFTSKKNILILFQRNAAKSILCCFWLCENESLHCTGFLYAKSSARSEIPFWLRAHVSIRLPKRDCGALRMCQWNFAIDRYNHTPMSSPNIHKSRCITPWFEYIIL